MIATLLLTTPGCGVSAAIAFFTADSASKSSGSNSIPPPVVLTVTPAQASHGGGTVVTVRGSNFPSDSAVADRAIRTLDSDNAP